MRAEVLADFLAAPPEFQQRMIEMQRDLDHMQDENERLRKLAETQRARMLREGLSLPRYSLVRFLWWAYCKSLPRWA